MSYARGAALCAAPKKLIRPARVRGREYTGISRGLLREINKIIRGKVMNKKGFLSLLFAAVSAASLASAISLAACTPAEDKHEHQWSAEWSSDGANHWHECSGCDEIQDESAHTWGEWEVTKEATATEAGSRQRECTVCGCTQNEVIPATGEQPGEHEHQWAAEWSSDETAHWHACSGCDEVKDEAAHQWGEWEVTKPATETETGERKRACDVCGKEEVVTIPALEYETVSTTVDFNAFSDIIGGTGVKPSEPVTIGKVTVAAGTYIDSSGHFDGEGSNCVNTQTSENAIVLDLAGVTNSISFKIRGASSKVTKVELLKEDGTVVASWPCANSENAEYSYGLAEGEELPAGKYVIQPDAAARVGNLVYTEELAQSAPISISVSGAASSFLAGREFNTSGLNVMLNYENGRVDALTSGYEIDSSAVKMDTAGTYTVTVSYTAEGASEPFTASYEVSVYAVDHIELSDHSLSSSRVTLPVQKLFNVGDTFNSDNLAVQAIVKTGEDSEEVFILNSSEYIISTVDMSTAGKKTVTVTETNSNKTASYDINVVDLSSASKTQVNVVANGTVGVNDGVLTVNSINDAMKFFELMGTEDSAVKTINVGAGEYYEKVEIDVPNVKLIGADADTTVIWYDALNGLTDPSGTSSYSTDGSATVSIRESATGFYAENITFKNYYNTDELYEQSKLIAGSGTQAVACLVQADKVYFKDCAFTSYQDTLYAMTGRHVYENCNIEGRTDYIFGYNATCYFKDCVINTINGNDDKNGGYIVATKGIDNGGDDVKYGYIFDGCTLTAEEGVVEGTVSLARGWDQYMTVAYINCDISAAYSKEAYGDTTSSKNDRYTTMNAAPHAELLYEYGNTGAGALTTTTPGLIEAVCTILTDEQAVEFTTLTTIFAAQNGNMVYADAWDGQPVIGS